MAYKYAKEGGFLRIVEKLVDYYVAKCSSDYVPYWDFNNPEIPNTVRDSSAAAITACGLQELFRVSGEERFKSIAFCILNSLYSNYLAEDNKGGILKHGCFHKPENMGVDESLIWGDYYFIEAIMINDIGGMRMGKEKSISIEIKENIYGQLEAIAQKQGSKLEYEIMEAIKSYIERMSAYSDDPFFQIGEAGKSGLKDLAKAHDKYLYG